MSRSPLPVYHDPCGWNALLPPRAPRAPAQGEIRARYAVIGAGYTGLAAARRLAELDSGAEIVVLEGSRVGEGSSARNSGFAAKFDSKAGLSTQEAERADRLNHFTREGFAYLEQAMTEGGFSCDLEKTGRILAAATELGEQKVRATLDGARIHGVEATFLDRAAIEARIGSAYYRTGVRTEEGFLLQPAALIRGLADALPANVRLFEDSPILAVDGEGPRVARTAQARVKADVVIFAANSAIKTFGYWRDGLVTIYTYAGLTEALAEADLARLGVPAWGVLPAHRLGSTLRRVGANRLMIRSLYAYEAPIPSPEAARALKARLDRRYPHLAHARLEYVWGGVTALTMNGSPRWGRLGEGLYGSAGCNGAGIVKGTVLGKRLAEMIVTGDPQEALRAAYGSADRIAPEPLRGIGFRVISAIERRKAGAEM